MAKFDTLAPRIMRDFMRDLPLDKFDAAAIAGNIGHETNGFREMQELRPTVAGSRGGYGWPQWTGPRRRAFEAWAKSYGYQLDSYEANYGFMMLELTGGEKAAVAALREAHGLRAKTIAFCDAYERPGVTAYDVRVRWAQRALRAFESAKGVNPKPLAKSRTMQGGVVGGVAGAGIIVDAVTTAQDGVQKAADAWSTGTLAAIVIGVMALIGAAVVIYARWDDAGRPWPPLGGKPADPDPDTDEGAPA